MCRTPEIVAYSVTEIDTDTMTCKDTGYAFMGSTDRLVDGKHTTYRCVNCDRWAYYCNNCGGLRCDSDIWHSVMGAIPLACRVCEPAGIDTTASAAEGGGIELTWVSKQRPSP